MTEEILYDVLLFEKDTNVQIGRRYNKNNYEIEELKEQFPHLRLMKTACSKPVPKPEPIVPEEVLYDA
jgi:hypothetical protein